MEIVFPVSESNWLSFYFSSSSFANLTLNSIWVLKRRPRVSS